MPLNATAFSEYPQAALTFLDNGGTPEMLDAALSQAGIANQPRAVATTDMTGDGKYEVVVSIFDPASTTLPPSGALLIYVCQEGQYVLPLQLLSPEGWGAFGIRYLTDVNNDGPVELITSAATCGASTCFEEVQILAWNGSTFEDRLRGTTTDLPYPDIRLDDPEGDGTLDLKVVGTGMGSVGAGPQRDVSRVFEYDPLTRHWIQQPDTFEPSNYRIHILHDADAAARNGDYLAALGLYGRVVYDTTLQDWLNPEKERADLAAYALFQSGVLYLLADQTEYAQTTFAQLQSAYPVGTPQYGYVELAAAFRQAFSSGGKEAGCAAVQEYATQHPAEILTPLGQESFGYGNPTYTPENLCPWQ